MSHQMVRRSPCGSRITAFTALRFTVGAQEMQHKTENPSLHFSPRGEAKCVRGPSARGASRLTRAGVLEQYVEHGKQAQRSPGGHMACFDRRVVRNAGWQGTTAPADKSLLASLEFPTISRQYPLFPGKKNVPEPVSTHCPTFSVGFTASAVSWEFPGLCGEPGVRGRPSEPHRPPPSHSSPAQNCPELLGIARQEISPLSQCPRTALRSQSASQRTPMNPC